MKEQFIVAFIIAVMLGSISTHLIMDLQQSHEHYTLECDVSVSNLSVVYTVYMVNSNGVKVYPTGNVTATCSIMSIAYQGIVTVDDWVEPFDPNGEAIFHISFIHDYAVMIMFENGDAVGCQYMHSLKDRYAVDVEMETV